jgi:hypothetical protein
MENSKANSKSTILNYGVLLGILSVVLGVVMYVTNAYLDPNWVYGTIGFLIIVVVVVLGIKAFKKQNHNFLSLKEALKIALGITLIAGIISVIWQLILMNVLEPDYMNQVADIQRDQMTNRFPNMSESQVNDAMAMNAKFTSVWIIAAMALIGNLFLGLIIGLITGLIMKNKNPQDV